MRMTAKQFQAWSQHLQHFTSETEALIAAIRSSPPVRRVSGRAKNITGRYPSPKMGVSIQFESEHVEFWAIYRMEHDDDVLEFYNQPSRIPLSYRAKSGRRATQWHTPDFFVLRRASAGWEEWKPAQSLDQLSNSMPARYKPSGTGKWCCPPGEVYAKPLGLSYRLRSSAEFHPLEIQNLKFLQDFWAHEVPPHPELEALALAHIQAQPGIPLTELLDAYPDLPVDVVWLPFRRAWCSPISPRRYSCVMSRLLSMPRSRRSSLHARPLLSLLLFHRLPRHWPGMADSGCSKRWETWCTCGPKSASRSRSRVPSLSTCSGKDRSGSWTRPLPPPSRQRFVSSSNAPAPEHNRRQIDGSLRCSPMRAERRSRSQGAPSNGGGVPTDQPRCSMGAATWACLIAWLRAETARRGSRTLLCNCSRRSCRPTTPLRRPKARLPSIGSTARRADSRASHPSASAPFTACAPASLQPT